MVASLNDTRHALETSAAHLRSLVGNLDAVQLAMQAYPTKWTIADVLSHIGSGAVIMRRRIEAEVDRAPVPDGFNQSVWDEWNAKDAIAKASDALDADRQLLDQVGTLTDEQIRQITTYLRSLEPNAPSVPAWRKGAQKSTSTTAGN